MSMCLDGLSTKNHFLRLSSGWKCFFSHQRSSLNPGTSGLLHHLIGKPFWCPYASSIMLVPWSNVAQLLRLILMYCGHVGNLLLLQWSFHHWSEQQCKSDCSGHSKISDSASCVTFLFDVHLLLPKKLGPLVLLCCVFLTVFIWWAQVLNKLAGLVSTCDFIKVCTSSFMVPSSKLVFSPHCSSPYFKLLPVL